MSSLRNAVKRKTHKERAQPAARKKFGLLEKHGDYVLRAKDYNAKRDRMNVLRLKASMRNPDEFYFGMHKTKTKEGVHEIAAAPGLDSETVHVLKTQDLAYVNLKKASDMKKAERLRAGLHMLGGTSVNKHTVFLDSKKKAQKFDPAEHFDTAPELADRAFNRPRVATLEAEPITGAVNKKDLKKALKKRDVAYRELKEREQRAHNLSIAAAHLMTQRAVMSNHGTKRKVQDAVGTKPAVYKWKRERAK